MDGGPISHPGQHPISPTSPRMNSGHVNSPHRGHGRFNHQNSSGNHWSANGNAGSGRRFTENGDHSNTGSLRRHQNYRGNNHGPPPVMQSK